MLAGEVDLSLVGAVGARARLASVRPSQRNWFSPRFSSTPSTSVRTGRFFESNIRTVTLSARLSLMLTVVRPREQPHTGENPAFGKTFVS